MKPSDTKEILASLQAERDGGYLYQVLAESEKDEHIAEVYRRMATTEKRHADAWVARLEKSGVKVPSYRPSWRTRLLSWLARRFGTSLVLPTILGAEKADTHGYSQRSDAQGMAADENSHARLLRNISGGMEGGRLAQLEGRHRAAGGNALRAAVLGANDGLVSNLSLVMGVAGAELSNQYILITGFAGLLAGAISMALGEWLSVQSSRELYEHQIGIERAEIASAPEEEAEELALIYQSAGIDAEQARSMARQVMQDPVSALDTLARES